MLVTTNTANICGVCGLRGTSGYAGTPPCEQSWAGDAAAHRAHLVGLKARGCLQLQDRTDLQKTTPSQ